MRIKFGRITEAARMQTLHSTFVELARIMMNLPDADDETREYYTIKLVTILEQLLRQTTKTQIETGKISPDKFVPGELPGPDKLGGDSLAHHIRT